MWFIIFQQLAMGGGPTGGVALLDYADPRQGSILGVDTDPAGVDPRQGTVLK